LIRAFGLRRKESVMLRPNGCIVPFESTGLPEDEQQADRYVWIRQGAKNGRQRFVPLNTPQRVAAIEYAQTVAVGPEAHLGNPSHDLKRNLRHFDYTVAKFGVTERKLGVTAHGLRHEALIDEFVAQTGQQPPVRGGVELPAAAEEAARLAVSRLAGHSRKRASSAYLGQSAVMRSNPSELSDPPADPNGSHCP
jgi:integrase